MNEFGVRRIIRHYRGISEVKLCILRFSVHLAAFGVNPFVALKVKLFVFIGFPSASAFPNFCRDVFIICISLS